MDNVISENDDKELVYEAQNISNGVLALLYSIPFAVIVFKLLRDRFIMSYNQKHQILYFYITIFTLIFFRFLSYIIYFFWSRFEVRNSTSLVETVDKNIRMAYYISYVLTNSISLPIFFSLTCLTSYNWYRMHLIHVNNVPEVKNKLLICKKAMIALNLASLLAFVLPLAVGPFIVTLDEFTLFFYAYHRILLEILCILGALLMYVFGSQLWRKITFLKKSSASKISAVALRFQILLGTVFSCFLIRGIIILIKLINFFLAKSALESFIISKGDDNNLKKLYYYYFILEWIPVCLFVYIIKPFKRKDSEDQDEVSINKDPNSEAIALF